MLFGTLLKVNVKMLLVHLLMLGMWMKKELQVNCQMLIKLEKSIDMEEFPDDRFVRGQLLAEFLHNRHLSLQEGGREAAVEAEEPQDQGQAEEDDERRIKDFKAGISRCQNTNFLFAGVLQQELPDYYDCVLAGIFPSHPAECSRMPKNLSLHFHVAEHNLGTI